MDDVSSKEFYAAFQTLGDSLRGHIDKRFNELDHKLDEHSAEDRLVANRVLTIEVERKNEAAVAIKDRRRELTATTNRITFTVAGMTIAASVIIEIVKHFFK